MIFDVVGFGLNATDTVVVVPKFPAYGGKVSFKREFCSTGGQVATAMVACARLRLNAKYIGAVGDDERGKIQLESLRAAGIDIADVQVRQDCPNQSAVIVVDESTGERTVFWNRAACLAVSPESIQPEQIVSARMLHIDGCDTAAAERAARIARENGIPVSLDVDTIYPGFDRVLPLVDYLIASSEFPARWTGINDPRAALRALQSEYGMRLAAMTLGADGALALTGGSFIYSPGFVVDCLDTTGAGDVFHGAMCYAVLHKIAIAGALEFANAMAALNCTAFGARGNIAPVEETRRLIRTGQRRARDV